MKGSESNSKCISLGYIWTQREVCLRRRRSFRTFWLTWRDSQQLRTDCTIQVVANKARPVYTKQCWPWLPKGALSRMRDKRYETLSEVTLLGIADVTCMPQCVSMMQVARLRKTVTVGVNTAPDLPKTSSYRNRSFGQRQRLKSYAKLATVKSNSFIKWRHVWFRMRRRCRLRGLYSHNGQITMYIC